MQERDITICGHGSNVPSLKNLYEYNALRYKSKMSNGERKQLLKVRRLKGFEKVHQDSFRRWYKTILGRNSYNQNLRQFVYVPKDGRYYSDCSSSGCATYQKCGFDIPLLNTALMLNSDLFYDLPVIIKDGHILNPEILRPGDALLYAGNIHREEQRYVGHVEYIYEIPMNAFDGWKEVRESWYYYEDGEPVCNAWRYISERWYVFAGDGRMVADEWFKDSTGLWYFLGKDGGMLAGQWLFRNGKSYYLTKDGHCAVNCYVKDERQIQPGVSMYYWVNDLGEWEPRWDTTTPDLKKYKLADAEQA